jgi:hypothetical protein
MRQLDTAPSRSPMLSLARFAQAFASVTRSIQTILIYENVPVIQTRVQKRNVLPGYDGQRSRSSIVPRNADWYKRRQMCS